MPSRAISLSGARGFSLFCALAGLLSCAWPTVGCSGSDEHPSLYGALPGDSLSPDTASNGRAEAPADAGALPEGASPSAREGGTSPVACAPGARRTCLEYRGDADFGYLFCERGVQVCGDGGAWGGCLVGAELETH